MINPLPLPISEGILPQFMKWDWVFLWKALVHVDLSEGPRGVPDDHIFWTKNIMKARSLGKLHCCQSYSVCSYFNNKIITIVGLKAEDQNIVWVVVNPFKFCSCYCERMEEGTINVVLCVFFSVWARHYWFDKYILKNSYQLYTLPLPPVPNALRQSQGRNIVFFHCWSHFYTQISDPWFQKPGA